ncbi:hypothetical protein [Dawidia cretensis]|uniref:hypothetical protein n=1 Tax=Dawidia cretensis TaxID=2782350 RepID=UPI00293D77A9|nr:hypothetical protein [Dawidia cretensis]
MIKYTTQFLLKMEEMLTESDYTLRYEKGNFKSGYCVLKDQKIMIVNKFFTTEGKINALLDILKNTTLDPTRFSDKSRKLHEELNLPQAQAEQAPEETPEGEPQAQASEGEQQTTAA